eukprot:CAMPEP_0198292140 /NCGR_PEP_ID=MMETSP1449-20131203/10060_1 /TAXON_ID=420275 /ORGANISM="Attheya septentrionalis, Strain CCMP2084" /LENGTH=102 /DNA_ID=CAMNT_0043990883 /DNA_START=288 /DNA_END=593 /DNA_ORIENTATION=-
MPTKQQLRPMSKDAIRVSQADEEMPPTEESGLMLPTHSSVSRTSTSHRVTRVLVSFVSVAAFLFLMVYFYYGSGNSDDESVTAMPGSDRDSHGCIPSTGYTW